MTGTTCWVSPAEKETNARKWKYAAILIAGGASFAIANLATEVHCERQRTEWTADVNAELGNEAYNVCKDNWHFFTINNETIDQ